MSDDSAAVVDAYWKRHRLSQGSRHERLAAQEFDWVSEAVNSALEGPDPLSLLDLLAAADDADLCYLGAGPVEDLLSQDPARWDAALAERCTQSDRWRRVLACVWLDDRERRALVAVAPFLPSTR